MSRAFAALVAAAFVIALSWSTRAHACGGLFAPSVTTVQPSMSGQLELISAHASSTDIVELIEVPTGGQFGMLIPAPVQPTVDPTPVAATDLEALEQATRATIVIESPSTGSTEQTSTGCGCGAKALSLGGAGGAEQSQDGGSAGVHTGQSLVVGPVTATTLTSNDGAALTAWLTQNGFVVPDGGQAILDSYVDAGIWFIALTQAADAGIPDGGVSVGLHYSFPAQAMGIALRLSSIGAGSTMSFTTIVAYSQDVGPGDATALTLDDLSATDLQQSYTQAVQNAVADAGGRAWVVEGDFASSVVPGSLAALLDPSETAVTRMSTIVTPAEMTYDVGFQPPGPAGVTSYREIMAGVASRAKRFHLGLLGLLVFGGAFLRRSWLRPD